MSETFVELTYVGAPSWVVFVWRTLLFTLAFSATVIMAAELFDHTTKTKSEAEKSQDPYIKAVGTSAVSNNILLIGAISSLWSLTALLYGRVQGGGAKTKTGSGWISE